MLSRNSAKSDKSVRKKRVELPTSIRLIGGLAALVLLGTSLLMMPFVSKGDGLTLSEALFTAVSALTVTGLTVITPAVDLTAAGKVILMLLIQAGGIGYMVFAILVFRLLGREVSLTDRMALQDALGLINLSGIVELSRRVLVTVLILELIGGICLFFHWRGDMPTEKAAFYAMFHAVSAFCNAGFDLFNGSGMPFPQDPVTLSIMGTLIVLGSLGIPVLFDLITYRKRRKITLHTRLTLITGAALTIWGMVAITFTEGATAGGVLSDLPLGRQLGMALFQSVSCRSAGFVGLPEFDHIAPSTELLMTTLMFIGGSPASMGGGITTGTFTVLVLALFAYVKRRNTPIVQGRAIPGQMVRKAAAVLTVSLFVTMTSGWLIMATHRSPLDVTIFEVTSAFATCGLSIGFTDDLSLFGRIVVVFMMFWGRLGALTMLFAFTVSKPQRRVAYPEEKVLIG